MASSPCLEECCGDGSSNEGLQGHDDLFDDLLFSVYSTKNMIVSAGWIGMEVFLHPSNVRVLSGEGACP